MSEAGCPWRAAAVSTYNFTTGGCVDIQAAAILGCSAMLSAPLVRSNETTLN